VGIARAGSIPAFGTKKTLKEIRSLARADF
jgi:hypothetical protein